MNLRYRKRTDFLFCGILPLGKACLLVVEYKSNKKTCRKDWVQIEMCASYFLLCRVRSLQRACPLALGIIVRVPLSLLYEHVSAIKKNVVLTKDISSPPNSFPWLFRSYITCLILTV